MLFNASLKNCFVLLLAGITSGQNTSVPVNIGYIIFPGFQPLDVFGPLDVFNALSIQTKVNLSLITSTLDPVAYGSDTIPWFKPTSNTSSTIKGALVPTYTFETTPLVDVLIVPGGLGTRAPSPLLNSTIDFIRETYPKLKYLITVCTGAGVAARAGVLDGKRATTNKLAWAQTIAHGPNVKWVAEARWVQDGNVWTSSGVSAGIDVALAFVTATYSEAVAVKVANMLEYVRTTNSTFDPFAGLYGLSSANNTNV